MQTIGDDFANTPPALALARRGIVNNIHGFTLYGDYARPNPPAEMLGSLARDEIDVAFAWGPLAGYFAKQERGTLVVSPLREKDALTGMPFTFAISIGVRKDEPALRDELDALLERERAAIDAILDEYGVPRVNAGKAAP